MSGFFVRFLKKAHVEEISFTLSDFANHNEFVDINDLRFGKFYFSQQILEFWGKIVKFWQEISHKAW